MIRVARIRRAVAAAALTAALLTACTWPPEPPEDVVAESEAYADSLRLVDGVEEMTVTVEAYNPFRDPGVWVTRVILDARAADDLSTLPARLAAIEPPSLSRLVLVARFPATTTLAPVVLYVGPDLAAPAEALRALRFVEQVHLDGHSDSVTLSPGTTFSESAASIRELSPWDALTSLRLSNLDLDSSIEISATAPTPELLALLDTLSADPSVDHLYLGFVDSGAPRSLSLDSSDPARIAAILDAFPPVEGFGLRYRVSSDDLEIQGCVGGEPC